MNCKIFFFSSFLFLGLSNSFSQTQTSSPEFLNSKTLYEPQSTSLTSAPKNYKSVFLNHVGRHGARHLTKSVESYLGYKLLKRADSTEDLTLTGIKLLKKINNLNKVEGDNIGSISIEGEQEQDGIGKRVKRNYPVLFTSENGSSVPINIVYTHKIRTQQTSKAFLDGFFSIGTPPDKVILSTSINDTILRFYDFSPGFQHHEENGEWITIIDSLNIKNNISGRSRKFANQFFSRGFLDALSADEFIKFTSDIFGFAAIFYSVQNEIIQAGMSLNDVDITPFFSNSDLKSLSKIDNIENFYEKGPGYSLEGVQVKVALPLLADFLKTVDNFINGKSLQPAIFRFTHAEAIAPLAAIMRIEGVSTPTHNIKSIDDDYSRRVIPLSSNIQWVLYRKKKSRKYLIKVLLNEKEVKIRGLSSKNFPYYKWKDLKAYYLKNVSELSNELNKSGFEYLQNLY